MASISFSASRIVAAFAVVGTLVLAGCTPYTGGPLSYAQSREGKDLVAYNYQAVDLLVKRAGTRITKASPLIVATVVDVNNVETSSALGRTITEQLGSRLAQLGYRVSEMKLRQGVSIQEGLENSKEAGEFVYSRNTDVISNEQRAVAALTGTYTVAKDQVLVNIRLVDVRTSQLITAYDYVLPRSADVSALANTRTNAPAYFFGQSWAY